MVAMKPSADLDDLAGNGVYVVDEPTCSDWMAAAAACHFHVAQLLFADQPDKAGVLDVFARELRFPDHFGHNWDALADCLGDLSWLPAPGYLLVLHNAPRELLADTLLEILEDTCQHARKNGRPMRVACIVAPTAGATSSEMA